MKICFIGASGHYGYALPELLQNPELKLVGASPGVPGEDMSRLYQQLRQKREQFPVYASFTQLLEQEKPDLAVINTHFQNNAALVKQAIRNHVHVFAEKPLALQLADLAEIEKLLAATGCQLTIMLGLRYAAHFFTAQQLCRQGAIGQVRLLQAQKSYRLGYRPDYYKNRASYGGTIPWVGIHAIDWLYWFTQADFLSVYAGQSTLGNQGHGQLEMTAQAVFQLEQEILGTISLDYCRPADSASHADDRLRVVGTAGVLEVRDEKVYLTRQGSAGTSPEKLLEPPDFFAEFCAQIQGRGRCSISAAEAIYISRISLLARQSADENCLLKLK